MARPTTILPEWATDAAFPPGAKPSSGQPLRDAAAMAGVAAQGMVPEEGTDAEGFNAWLGLLSEWQTHLRLETENVATRYSLTGSQATDDVLADALDLKGGLAAANVWSGTNQWDGAATLRNTLTLQDNAGTPGRILSDLGHLWQTRAYRPADGTPPVLVPAGAGFAYSGSVSGSPYAESYLFTRQVTSSAVSFELVRLHHAFNNTVGLVRYHLVWWTDNQLVNVEYARGDGVFAVPAGGSAAFGVDVVTGVVAGGTIPNVIAPQLYSPDVNVLALEGNHNLAAQTVNYAGLIQIARFNDNQ
jgi:hypothetical protein